MFDQAVIEKLKTEFTDKYVVVDAVRPELSRFVGLTGIVKTVNMSGKALVEFDGRLNIGWYDIGLDFLKIVPKPEPKPVEEKAKKAAPAEKPAAAKPAAAPAVVTGEKKPSVAEMLKAQAAAKAAASAAPAAPAPAAEVAPPAPAPEPVVEKKPEPKPAGEAKKLSTAEILAALKKKP